MKITFPFLSLILISSYSFAQKVDQCPTGQQRFEIAISLNTPEPSYPVGPLKSDNKFLDGGHYKNKTISIGLLGKYFLNDNNNEAIRIRFVFTDKNISDYREEWGDPVHSIYDIHYKQRYYKISPGFQWTIGKNKISLYGGIEVPFTIIGKNTQQTYALNESIKDPVFFDEGGSLVTIPGGYSVGPGLFFGSNYFFTKNIAIGFDLSAAYLYTSVGGRAYGEGWWSGTHGNTDGEWYGDDDSIKQYRFSPVQGAINLTVKF